jgi:hypothetical protein
MKCFTLLPAVLATLLFSTLALATDDGNFSIGIATGLPATVTTINLSNSGASWGQFFGGTVGNGQLCANVYVFSPDEQEQACCACPLSPNSLHSFTALDLIANTLTGAQPTSIVIKIVATENTTGACDPSSVTPALLAPGLTVWQRRGDSADVPFISSTLSAKELQRAVGLCQGIVNNGSFSGICKTCALGGR